MLLEEDRLKVIEEMEERSHNLGELCSSVISDLKSSGPVWEDFICKANRLHNQTRTFVSSFGAFVDSFQRIADIATKSSGNLSETKEIGATLTRMCLRQRSVESKLRLMNKSFNDNIICKLNQEIDDWRKNVTNLDKEYNKSMKEHKKRRNELRKKASTNLKLHTKLNHRDNRQPKNRDIQRRLNEVFEELSSYYTINGERQKQSLRSALVEERSQLCSFANYIRPCFEMQVSICDELCLMNELLLALHRQTSKSDVLQSELEECFINKLSVNGEYRAGRQTSHRVLRKPTSTIGNLTRCTRIVSKQRRATSPSLTSLFSMISQNTSCCINTNNKIQKDEPSLKNSFQYAVNSPKSAIYNLSRDSGFTSQDHFYSSSSKTAYSLCLTKRANETSIKGFCRKLTDGDFLKGHSRRPPLNSRLFYPPITISKRINDSIDSFDSNDHTIIKSTASSNEESFLTLPLPPSTFFEDPKLSQFPDEQCDGRVTLDKEIIADDAVTFSSSTRDHYQTNHPVAASNERSTFNQKNALLNEIERGVQLKKVAHHPRLS